MDKLWILGCIMLSISALCFGVYYGRATYEPKAIIEEVPVEVVRIVKKTIEVPIIVEVIKKVEVEVPMKLRDFESVEELTLWLALDNTDKCIIILEDEPDCEDYALLLQNRGIKAGYKINVQILYEKQIKEFYDVRVKKGIGHALNLVRIGNEWWYIEPQTDKIWLAGYLD